MKKLSESEVKKILEEHELWLKTEEEGDIADFMIKDLSGMDFHGCDLQNAWFDRSDLMRANFQNAILRGADFSGARLKNADFRGADLTNANFHNTDMDGVIYDKTTSPVIACPEEGAFIGYKKAYDSWFGVPVIVKLQIPEDAKRSSATRTKCRCSKAEVLSITELDGTETDVTVVRSGYNPNFIYRLGETVEVLDFDECRWHECTTGIHFFMDRKDAVKW